MRVVTFNILHGRSPADGALDLPRFQEAVASLDADVLALQEVDLNQPRSGGLDLTAAAAEAMGAVDHRFVAALSGSPGTWVAATGRERPDTAAYGVALLSRHRVSAWQVIRLRALGVRVPMWIHGGRRPSLVRDEPRVAVAAVVERPGGAVTVATTHLSFVPWSNGRQLRALVRALRDVPSPLLLAGDLNMRADRASAITGLRPLVAAPTFPVDRPREQIDHVLADGSFRVALGEARRLPLSDHRALVVDLV